MQVVAHAGAIAGVVVGAEDLDGVPSTGRHLKDVRDQVSLRIVPFAEPTECPTDVEVAQAHGGQAVRLRPAGDRHVDGELALAVRVDRAGGLVLTNGHPAGTPYVAAVELNTSRRHPVAHCLEQR